MRESVTEFSVEGTDSKFVHSKHTCQIFKIINSKTGINSTIIPSYEGQEFTRLSVYNGNTFKEANKRLQELMPEYGNEIWILKY